MIGMKAWIGVEDANNGIHHEAGGGEQDQGQSYFYNN